MKRFSCQVCGQLLFFENSQCLNCGSRLGYLPDLAVLSALESDPAMAESWVPLAPEAGQQSFRLCTNYSQHNVCNWLVPADSDSAFCRACQLNRTIPSLDLDENQVAWYRLEVAKRRLVYSLLALNLPVESKEREPEQGLAFDFLADLEADPAPVLIGHADGLITLNIAEADDAYREQTRTALGEPYRTLLGHFRHEIGHYYWDRLIRDSNWLAEFRQRFGDERGDYQAALEQHYRQGPPLDWQQHFVSAYATSHPWEDWAETWAHYIHIVDAIETAQAFGLSVQIDQVNGDANSFDPDSVRLPVQPFEQIFKAWLPLTFAVNSLNRSLGQPDLYPFVLPPRAVEKLDFVHRVIKSWA